ncbi:MAG TPA: hypothetical protein VLK59_02660 [Solirubrobacteraceae bacterium]|nr:hypothetical protein [Solirubrobacteraceae bacterium]
MFALAAAPGVAGPAGERVHRLHVPPPLAQAVPHSIALDEFEWGMRGTHLEVAAGRLQIHVYNRGMDDHDLAVVDAQGVLHTVPLASGADAVLDVNVAAGPVKLFCSLFAGTPDSHEDKGMVFNVTAK